MEIRSEMLDLVRAFDEARLVAMHIDMQLHFNEHHCKEGRIATQLVFPVVKKFVSDLKAFNIKNHWVAFTGAWGKSQYADYRKAAGGARGLRLFPGMGFDDNDFIFFKAEQWAFESPDGILASHLRNDKTDTIIIDGVKDLHCITDTIATGVKAGFHFYVALDATNCPLDKFDEFASGLYEEIGDEYKNQIVFTTTHEILGALHASQNKTAPKFASL